MGKLWPQWSHCNCEGAGVFIHQPQSLRVASGGYKFPSTLGLSPRQNDFLNDRESLEKQRTLGRQLECARRVRSWGWRQALSAYLIQFSSVVQLCLTWTTAHQASLSISNSQSLPKPMSIESGMPSNRLILCRPLLLLLSFPASGSFHMSQLFASGCQSIGISASTSVLPMNTQDWSPLLTLFKQKSSISAHLSRGQRLSSLRYPLKSLCLIIKNNYLFISEFYPKCTYS